MHQQSPESALASTPWYVDFFDMQYGATDLLPTDEREIERVTRTVADLATLLHLTPGSLLFDQCAGLGRMSRAFGRLGVRTIGVDQSAAYVAEATRLAEAEALPCRFFEGDAFEWVAPEPCDAGINWFTSFGYVDDDERSLEMLKRMRDSLRHGGRFLLDVLSLPWLFASFRTAHFRRSTTTATAGLLILDETAVDFRRGVIISMWTFIRPDGTRTERRAELRLFMPHELVRLCERAGFTVLELLGAPDGRPYDRESRRLQVLCER